MEAGRGTHKPAATMTYRQLRGGNVQHLTGTDPCPIAQHRPAGLDGLLARAPFPSVLSEILELPERVAGVTFETRISPGLRRTTRYARSRPRLMLL